MCPLDTWPRGTDKGPADLVEAYTLQTHYRWDTEQVGRIYFQTWHGIFTFNPNNKAPPAICKPKRKGLQVLRVYAFRGDGWFLFGMAPKVLLQGNPKVPKQTLQHSIVEHLAGKRIGRHQTSDRLHRYFLPGHLTSESNIFYSLSCTHFNLFSRCYKGFVLFFLTKLRRSNFQSTDVCYLLSNKDSKYLPVVLPAQQQWFAPQRTRKHTDN